MRAQLVLILWVFLLGCGSRSGQEALVRKAVPFNSEDLSGLKPFDDTLSIEKSNWLLVAYVPDVSCQTCTNRDLKYMGEMSRQGLMDIDFTLICNLSNREYIRNIRRIAQCHFPIYVVDEDSSIGLIPRFHFLLVDKAKGESVLLFYPSAGLELKNGMKKLEKEILKIVRQE